MCLILVTRADDEHFEQIRSSFVDAIDGIKKVAMVRLLETLVIEACAFQHQTCDDCKDVCLTHVPFQCVAVANLHFSLQANAAKCDKLVSSQSKLELVSQYKHN